jgi:hypothetical protein
MYGTWGPAIEAEIAYRTERIVDATHPSSVHWPAVIARALLTASRRQRSLPGSRAWPAAS